MAVTKKSMMNENADKNDQNIGSDDDHREAIQNEYEDLVNVLQNKLILSFENVWGMSEEEKIMFKNYASQQILDEEVNRLK